MNSKISALYCTKNESEFIADSISTIIDQVDEVVVLDTLSTDGTVEIVRELAAKNPKIKLFQHNEDFDRACEYACRNIALSKCKGDWIIALDADQFMADGWLEAVTPYMGGRTECIGIGYVHCVGDIKHHHDSSVGVPPTIWAVFKHTNHMKWKPASEVVAWAKPMHHASAERSCSPGSLKVCPDTYLYHLGFCRRDMERICKYRIGRGDSGHEPEKKSELIAQLEASKNPFLFCGPVCEISQNIKPPSILIPHLNDYELEISGTGYIQRRKHVASGEYC